MAQFTISLLFLVILHSSLMQSGALFSSSPHHFCHPHDALSLLQFKEEMLQFNSFQIPINASFASQVCDFSGQYSYPKMISWNKTSSDCCTWDGVTCHRSTGHVIGLDLSCSRLWGFIHHNSSLFRLSHLQKLNLAFNDFHESEISPQIGGLSSLTHLNLSSSSFRGIILSELSHLSKLVLLDLTWFDLRFSPRDFHILLQNLTHISVLSLEEVDISTTLPANWSSSLTHLNLGYTRVHGKLSKSIFHLPRLQTLILYGTENLTVSLPKSNCSIIPSLEVLDLSSNLISNGIPNSIGSFVSLKHLGLNGCQLSGSFPISIGNLSQIVRLNMGQNNFTGNIPSAISSLPKLTELYLGYNSFTGQLPSYIGNFTELTTLSISRNLLSGPLPSNISGLRKLTILWLHDNAFGGTIPSWLFSMPSLKDLSLARNSFTGQIKEFTARSLESIDFSSNQLDGPIPNSIQQLVNLRDLVLSSNNLSGSIEFIMFSHLDNLVTLDLSNNSLSGLESSNILASMKNLSILNLRSNKFQEPLPLSICNFKELLSLDLSHNNFTGPISECFGNFSRELEVLNLAKNDLKGPISMTFPKDNSLRNLNLNGNSLEGPLPRSLANCKYLEVLDVGNNKINDTFPAFLKNLKLQVLILKLNRFSGSLSSFKNENFLPKLRVFDISCNEFSGSLPLELLKSFKAMISLDKIEPKATYMESFFGSFEGQYHYSMSFVMKGQSIEFTQILTTLVVIDFSSNNFTGEIPKIIGNLNSLIALNLSHNNFSGHIPSTLGELHSLESLDLSWNQFEGEIPWQLANLTNLGFLNLSQNHLIGRIPQGKQFNTFLNGSYYGNLGLCGFPMTKDCGEMDLPSPPSHGSYQDDADSSFWSGFTWKSMLIGYGFGTIFGFAIGCLIFFTGKPKWLARNIEEVCWYGLPLLGKKEMHKQLKKSRRRGRRHNKRNNQHFGHNQGKP